MFNQIMRARNMIKFVYSFLKVVASVCTLSMLFLTSAQAQKLSDKCVMNYPNSEQLGCLYPALERADKRLNEVYQGKIKNLAAGEQQSLRKAQRRWIAQRDKSCSELRYSGGQGAGIHYVICLLDETQARTGELLAIR